MLIILFGCPSHYCKSATENSWFPKLLSPSSGLFNDFKCPVSLIINNHNVLSVMFANCVIIKEISLLFVYKWALSLTVFVQSEVVVFVLRKNAKQFWFSNLLHGAGVNHNYAFPYHSCCALPAFCWISNGSGSIKCRDFHA